MGKLIDTQVAIDRFIDSPMFRREVKIGIINVLEDLPPADIVTCDKCKHGVPSGRGDTYLCVVSPEERGEHKYNFWCAYGDRREEW